MSVQICDSSACDSPVMVEVRRGSTVESCHRGRAVVADASGRVVASWGDSEAPIIPRSAVKPIQALPLVESGALYAYGLEQYELALACGSHHGEGRQVRMLESWMKRIGCQPGDLACGAHAPLDEEATVELIRSGQAATVIHNNCSGKHLGMLTTARHLGEPLKGYTAPEHPVQQRIQAILQDLTGCALGDGPALVDGCGAPTFAVPLRGLAVAMARFADTDGFEPARVTALDTVRNAWSRHASFIGGRTSFDTKLMQSLPGTVLVKSGAEGVVVAVLTRQKLGLALKIEDGAPRAKNVALMALLRHLGVIDAGRWQSLSELAAPVVTNWSGKVVGGVRPAEGWLNEAYTRG
ncbi:MAG: asparaginase [Rhodospirillaceae bacterium]